MENIIEFDKNRLISELKGFQDKLVKVYNKIFQIKYSQDASFQKFIDKEYADNNILEGEKEDWNLKFCHKTTYTLLNKVLFIRICEDMGFMLGDEDKYKDGTPKNINAGTKLTSIGYQKWTDLITNNTLSELLQLAFKDMSKSYPNIALFKENKYEKLNFNKNDLEEKFFYDNSKNKIVDEFEEVLKEIIQKLDVSRYNFNEAVKTNVLGDVYEKFMDRDTRKALGQFYTPDFIIDYILENTVEEVNVVENPFVKVLDPACGSGHFLIKAYDILRKKFSDNLKTLREKYGNYTYEIKINDKIQKVPGKEYWQENNLHYHILKNCIYGADIDDFAVQLTTINLLLKDFKNTTDELNIIQCDSLVKWEEDYDWDDLRKQLEEQKLYYTIKKKNFTGVISEKITNRNTAENIVKICIFWNQKFDYIVGNPPYFNIKRGNIPSINFYQSIITGVVNISSLFIKKALSNATKNTAFISYILPKSFLRVESFKGIRREMLREGIFIHIADAEQSFSDVGYEVAIFVYKNSFINNNYIKIDLLKDKNFSYSHDISQDYFYCLDSFPIYLDNTLLKLVDEITKGNAYLGEISDIFRGLPISINSPYLSSAQTPKYANKILRGESIWYYCIKKYAFYCEICEKYDTLKNKLQKKKIVMPNIMSSKIRLNATIDFENLPSIDTVTNLILIDSNYNYEEILGILNSKLITFYTKEVIFNRSKLTMHLDAPYLGKIPIPIKNINNVKIFDRISQNVSKLMSVEDLYQFNIDEDNVLNKYIEFCKKETEKKLYIYTSINLIDQYVYYLYKLSPKEIDYLEHYDINYSYYAEENNIRYELRLKYKKNIIEYNLVKDISIEKIKKQINPSEFVGLINNNTIEEIAEKYKFEYVTVALLREEYAKQYGGSEPWRFYNLSELYNKIFEYLKDMTIGLLKDLNSYASLGEIKDVLVDKCNKFNEFISIMRNKDASISSSQMIKEVLNKYSETWNSYWKNRNADKETLDIIKYDTSTYGLASWSDEIHKEYFLNAVNEYTGDKPNKKKAEEILNIIKKLDIDDKEEYISVIQKKVDKAFNRR